MTSTVETQVLVVGGGPVGLTLAIELGQRGVSCVVVERNDAVIHLPKMELCNARSMEIFGRLGLAEEIRAAGYPGDLPMDVIVTKNLNSDPIARLVYPSAAEVTKQIVEHDDANHPREAYARISQYTLEPLLRRAAERTPGVDVRFSHRLEAFVDDGTTVVADVVGPDGPVSIRADYMVGCDGGSSTVRRQLGIELDGSEAVGRVFQVFFRCDDLLDRHPLGAARHYHFIGDVDGALITQDDLRHYALHARVADDVDPHELVDRVVGAHVDAEVLHVGWWTPHLLVANRYAEGRAFIAGDAAHQFIPTGGFGLNTGIGDASNLGWKLAATLAGWAGPGLLASYDVERRPVATRNCAASAVAAMGGAVWHKAFEDGARGDDLAAVIDVEQRKCHEMPGIELGYRYAGSPVIVDEPGGPEPDDRAYHPVGWPGERMPHVWARPNVSLHDELGAGYTVVRLADDAVDPTPLAQAIADTGAPVATVELPHARLRSLCGDVVLVRPDLHIAWRGSALPPDPRAVALVATGHLA